MATSNVESNSNKGNVVPFCFRAYISQDKDLINYLRGVGNITKYIKELIREDIESKKESQN